MKAKSILENRLKNLENRMNDISNEIKGKKNKAKTVLSSVLILEKAWRLIKYLFSELNAL